MATLLLADDSATIQRVIELTFADENIRVVAVGSGRAAIDEIKRAAPDIVLADIGMPDGDGYDVGAFVKGDAAFSRIPVLLLTGALEPLDEARARAVCDGVLIKPFEPQAVIARVRQLLHARPAGGPAAGSLEPPALTVTSAARVPRDAYFARLGAAVGADEPDSPVPFAGSTPVTAPVASGAGSAPPPPVAVSLPEAFAALLAAEQGQAVMPAAPAAPFVTDALIDDIATRVIQRMGDASMRQVVLDAAERLVREEIARIKGS